MIFRKDSLKSMFCNKILALFSVFFVLGHFDLSAQESSFSKKIRFSLWAEMEVIPGDPNLSEKNGIYDYAISQIKSTCPFLMEGMVYGWDFSYTPSDSERNVEEFFELIPKVDYSYFNKKIHYTEPLIEDNKLYCWCEYDRNESEIQNYYLWDSIQNQKIGGRGYGALTDNAEGLKEAVTQAAKNAIREYYQGVIKTKPKEITGAVLIKSSPEIGLDAGRFSVKLDFLLENGKIVKYVTF